ncbi:MAG: family 20 glycosylhydrolase [Planctomycetaceae bacterium]
MIDPLCRGLGRTAFAVAVLCAVNISASNGVGAERAHGGDLTIEWGVLRNDDDSRSHHGRWTITNNGSAALPASGWTIWFNMLQLAERAPTRKIDPAVKISHFSGDMMRLQPTDKFKPIPPGESFTFEYHGEAAVNKECWAPCGLYIVFTDEQGHDSRPELIGMVTVNPFTKPEQINRGKLDQTPIPTPAYLHEQNSKLSLLPADNVGPITPTPVLYRASGGERKIDSGIVIRYGEGLASDAGYLSQQLQWALGAAPRAEPGDSAGDNVILLRIGKIKVGSDEKTTGSEAYTLDVAAKGITITGADADGVFYGIQSLLQLLPPTAFAGGLPTVTVPLVHVEDAPRYAYRGQHIDVSHNFHSKESILRLLDVMAFYKVNTLHFQVSDDEGWRIEIPELPELTEIGGGRAHTSNNDGALHPTYGAGPFRDPPSFGSGFYTRADYIEILRHARDLHIQVIPEINMPAHARAALIAMKTREKRLFAKGNDTLALEFRLHDPDDTSRYFSAQSFMDNTVCVVDEPVYHFAEVIIRNFQEMFAEAGMPLTTWHFGADEVPDGVWTASPRCAEYLKQHPEIKGPADLKNYFVRRIIKLCQEKKLQTACWQEAALDHVTVGKTHQDNPVPEFAGGQLIPYVWNNTRGNEDLCNRFANIGYPVVLCCVSNLYWDLAYNKDPLEPGLTWAGFVDARAPFEFVPEDVFKSTRVNAYGHPYDRAAMYREREKLTDAGLKNVLGIQGQIWCETIKGPQMLEYYAFPKLLGMAERAWAAQPEWARLDDLEQHDAAVQTAWNEFANRLGQRELPRLDALFGGIGYRLPPPGAVIKDGKLTATTEYPGLVIRYSTNGNPPTMASPVYTEPVAVKGPVLLSTFNTQGRAGRASRVE